jgi:hypothetical protein
MGESYGAGGDFAELGLEVEEARREGLFSLS